ncbi:glucose-6-phosphate isomerase [Xanthomonas arboricola]|uniref:glucose-6-phosphate isomerase n=1 Tax=Xanthomonas cannabis TaxID=1885674 RepID=UPI00141BBC6B|nr:glucose-6-phosphate isomerase [Xanthomonas cannabis]MBB3802114.1 glucose-6-phosphate isomerase [Xanthomonas cannabis]NIK01486.1 glucose-6-phosphate isomerase [Xanthomonas cannabis]NIK62526.1 glucose-6-phosphate isomerase [Xanthomonas cannabis]
MTQTNGFDALHAHAQRLRGAAIPALLAAEPERPTQYARQVGPLYFNFARQRYDRAALDSLFAIARERDLAGAFQRLFRGEQVNVTEQRAALHTALRGDLTDAPVASEAYATAAQVRQRMGALIQQLEATEVTDIVSVGIGGSDLGPRLVADALRAPSGARFRVHFVSNVDGAAMQRTLATLDPARTAGILISKTFGTQETLLNGSILHAWLGGSERLYAVSANPERAAKAFDIAPGRVLPMWDWVGGRYSLWSAVGFPIALAIGFERFEQLLEGAAQFDAHVLNTPLEENVAVLHGLTAVWNRNLLGSATHAVMTYDQRLALLPAYLQQLVMESLGKRVKLDGSAVDSDTVAVWWGGAGTDVQHSFFQALHQGTSVVPADFIGTVHNDDPYAENHVALMANVLAQTEALANGQDSSDPHRSYPGGRPSTVILLDALTPQALGALISMYEHSVYVQSVMWGINAFDQFGVELGKQLASQLLPALKGEAAEVADPVTRELLGKLRG